MSPLDNQIRCDLEQSPHFLGQELRIETSEGRVTLRGVVRSYYQKQMAQETCGRRGGRSDQNELEVNWAYLVPPHF